MKKESCYDRVEMKLLKTYMKKRKLLRQGWNETVENIYEKKKAVTTGLN